MAGRRVVRCSTGAVGAIALRVLAERPDLELAGVWVHDPFPPPAEDPGLWGVQ